MRKSRAGKVLRVVLIATAAVFVFGEAVTQLWNVLMPDLFGLHKIGFWQALGLLLLGRILLGGLHGRPRYGHRWRRRMFERWERMTPEEREKFRQGIRHRFGRFDDPAADSPLPR